MKINPRGLSFVVAATLALGSTLFAQHGGGRPAGVGGGSMGMGGSGMGSAGRPSDIGPGNAAGMGETGRMGSPELRSQSPSSVLSNPHLATSLTNALGKSGISIPGGNLQTACGGFKNLGQCITAMHVSKNLGLNFADLQSRMTGSNSVSLGKAIQELGGPQVNAKSESKKANKQANQDLNSVESAS